MNIALVSEWLDAGRGGAETSVVQFLQRLRAHPVQVHVFTRSRSPAISGITVHTVRARGWSRAARSRSFRRQVEAELPRHPFDVVHAVTPCRGADIYQPRGGTVAESIRRNLALRPRGLARWIKRGANRLNIKLQGDLAAEREMMRGGAVVAALSNYVARQVREHYQWPDDRIRLIYNGVDTPLRSADERAANRAALRRELGVADQEVLVLLLAHNFRLKGVASWMQAQALLMARGVHQIRALVVGRGVNAAWRRRARNLGLSRNLIFTGSSDRVAALRDAADVLVHPTYYDPCSRVVLEALADGLPCVASRWDGSSELIVPGETGFVIDDPDDIEALAECVRGLLDPAVRARMTRNATDGRRRLSMERHAAEMIALYREILARRSCR